MKEPGLAHLPLPFKVHVGLKRQTAQLLGVLVALSEDLGSSQDSHGSSQLPVTPVPGNLMPSSGLCGHCTYGTQTLMKTKHPYILRSVCQERCHMFLTAPGRQPSHRVPRQPRLYSEHVSKEGQSTYLVSWLVCIKSWVGCYAACP